MRRLKTIIHFLSYSGSRRSADVDSHIRENDLAGVSIRFLFWIFVLFAMSSVVAFAEEPISVTAQVDRAEITIGDLVNYEIRIRHLKSVDILTQIPTINDNALKVKKTAVISEKDGPYLITGKRITFSTFSLGSIILEPITIKYRQDKGEIKELTTERIYIEVVSIAQGEEKSDIRDIKSVVSMIRKYFKWIIAAVILFILIVAFFALKPFFHKAKEQIDAAARLTPEQEALIKLNRLFDSDLIRRDKYNQYYFLLSEILRNYLEKRFFIQATEATTFEIDKILRKKQLETAIREKIIHVLENADLAKFAKWKPAPLEVSALNKKSKEIVEETTPKVVVPEGDKQEEVANGV